MAAANEGAARARQEGGGQSIGLSIKAINGQPINPFVETEYAYNWIVPRIGHFGLMCSAYILMPGGGVGFFAELFVAWQEEQFKQLCQPKLARPKPLVLVGNGKWTRLLDTLREDWSFRPDELGLISPVTSTKEAAEIILADFDRFKLDVAG